MTGTPSPNSTYGDYRPTSAMLTPRIDLPVNGGVRVDGTDYIVERRLGDRWHLLGYDKDILFLDDQQVATKMATGDLVIRHGDGRGRAPLSPLVVGEKAAAKNAKKYAYVKAIREQPGGLRRSRPAILPIIAAVADQRGEEPPGFTSVLSWLDLYQVNGELYGTAALSDRDDTKGRAGGRVPAWAEDAMARGLEAYKVPRTTRVQAYAQVVEAVRAFEEHEAQFLKDPSVYADHRDADGRLRPPSLRTFERRCENMDKIERDMARLGPSYVAQNYSTWQTMALPERPYEAVEVDHCTLDIRIADETGSVYGRPDLVIFRDRATAMILGYGLGFEAPSYASFMQGLKSTYFPKDMSRFPAVTNPWPCVGRIENLYVDNALHFIGNNIQHAANELGFNVTMLQPKQPWLKGALERFFGNLNVGLVHALPGSTLGSIKDRNSHEYLEDPTLTLEQFEQLLVFWICQDYHVRVHGGLGFIRGAGDVPLNVWETKVAKYRSPPLPSPELFKSLAGDRTKRVIGRQGIEWDRIFYESPELTSVLAHPEHKSRGQDGQSTKYEVVRDPFDLGSVSLIDHHTGRIIELPASPAYREYASKTTLHQHQVHLARSAERVGRKNVNIDDLMRSRALLQDAVGSMRKAPSKKKLLKGLARYLDGNEQRHRRSEVAVGNPAAKEIGFVSASAKRPKTKMGWDQSPAGRKGTPLDDDLDFLIGAPLESSYDD